jgi:hypothetical protein
LRIEGKESRWSVLEQEELDNDNRRAHRQDFISNRIMGKRINANSSINVEDLTIEINPK